MTKKKKDRKPASFYLNENLTTQIDIAAKKANTSRSNLVEPMLEQILRAQEVDDDKPMVIAAMSFKGGVAKTTTIVNVATYLAEHGKRVLCIDLDPQGNLSQTFHVFDIDMVRPCIQQVLCRKSNGESMGIEEVMIETPLNEDKRLYIVPSDLRANNMSNDMVSELAGDVTTRLKEAIEDIDDQFDYIFIDCPPALNIVVTNAILATQAGNRHSLIIVPIKCDMYSTAGLDEQLYAIKRASTKPCNIRILYTMTEPRSQGYTRAHEIIENNFQEYETFDTEIPKAIAVPNTSFDMLPVVLASPRTKIARTFRALAEEIVEMNDDVIE